MGRDRKVKVLCPCCFAARLLLDYSLSIDSYCCIHSSVSLVYCRSYRMGCVRDRMVRDRDRVRDRLLRDFLAVFR